MRALRLPSEDRWRGDIYDACARTVRADRCGPDKSTGNTGTLIDKLDDRNIRAPDNLPDQACEAGWIAGVAVFVALVRIKGNTSLDRVVALCSGLAGELDETYTLATRMQRRLGCSTVPVHRSARNDQNKAT